MTWAALHPQNYNSVYYHVTRPSFAPGPHPRNTAHRRHQTPVRQSVVQSFPERRLPSTKLRQSPRSSVLLRWRHRSPHFTYGDLCCNSAHRSKYINGFPTNAIAPLGTTRTYVHTPFAYQHFLPSIIITCSRAFRLLPPQIAHTPNVPMKSLALTLESPTKSLTHTPMPVKKNDRPHPDTSNEHKRRQLLTKLFHASIYNVGLYIY